MVFGHRTSKTDDYGNTTTYLYDGDNPIQETRGGTVTTLLTGLGIDERFARDDAAYGRTYFLTDALGSTLALTDASGAVRQTYAYEPYGEVASSGDSDNPYQYTGRENDGTGLYYYRARYYSPGMKRFIAEDPMGLDAGLNEYAYVNGSPTNRNDPYGLEGIGPWTFPPGPDRDRLLCGTRCANKVLLCNVTALGVGLVGGMSCTYLCVETKGLSDGGFGSLHCPIKCGEEWTENMWEIMKACREMGDQCLEKHPCESCSQ